MSTTETRESILPNENFNLSQELAIALAQAQNSLPAGRSVVEVYDLLHAIVAGQSKGSRLIEIATQKKSEILQKLQDLRLQTSSKFQGIAIKFQGKDVYISPSLALIIKNARKSSSVESIETSDIVLTEASQSRSLIKSLLPKSQSDLIERLLPAINERFSYREEGAVVLETRDFQGIVVSPTEGIAHPEIPVEAISSPTVDLVEEATKGKIPDLIVRPEWVNRTMTSLTHSHLTVLIGDTEETMQILSGIASEIAKDVNQIPGIRSLIIPDLVTLEENPDLAIQGILSQAKEGQIIYLPELNRYLTNGRLRAIIAAKKLKIVTNIPESAWPKAKLDGVFSRIRPIQPGPYSIDETIAALTLSQPELQSRFRSPNLSIKITPEAIVAAAKFADRYYRDAAPPRGAFELVTEAASQLIISGSSYTRLKHPGINPDAQVDPEDIRLAVKTITGIEVSPDDPKKFLEMESTLGESIIGQPEALAEVSEKIRIAMSGFKDPKRPIGSFIFAGASGVGKTELCKALAEFLFDNANQLVVVPMAQYQEKHTVSRLVGAPPGYVGYEEGGQLTEPIRKNPYSIVVFDEFEKACREVQDVLINLLEEGWIEDGQGRKVDFRNTVPILTCNIGTQFYKLLQERGMEFVRKAVETEVRDSVRPEFFNRIDALIVFRTLTPEDLERIVDLQLKKQVNSIDILKSQNVSVGLSPEARTFLSLVGYDPQFGARPIRRAVQKHIVTKLSIEALKGEIKPNTNIVAELQEGQIILTPQSS